MNEIEVYIYRWVGESELPVYLGNIPNKDGLYIIQTGDGERIAKVKNSMVTLYTQTTATESIEDNKVYFE